MFGELEINVANQFHEPGFPEVMVLSNMTADGKPIGLGDAGQGWHTDMSYSKEVALANVLYAIKVPMRDGRPLGDTQLRNIHAAYDDLPAGGGKRRAAAVSVPTSGAEEIFLRPPMGARRRADVGQYRHSAQCRRRLRAARAALHAPPADHGDQGLRAPGCVIVRHCRA